MKSHDRRRTAAPDTQEDAARAAPPRGLLGLQPDIGNQAVLAIMRRERAGERRERAGDREDGYDDVAPAPGRSDVEAGLRTPGRPLDRTTLLRKETQFQADLSGVRMHTGPAAQEAAAAVRARAFTVGQDIVIGAGGGDSKTLDHELTHAVRNRQRASVGHPTGGGFNMTHPDDHEEREAESNAARMRAGGGSAVLGEGSSAGVQRVADFEEQAPVQRMQDTGTTDESAEADAMAEAAEATGAVDTADPAEEPAGRELISRLSQSIELNTVQATAKRNIFAPGTWWPEQWMVRGPARLRKTLERRVMRGEVFGEQDLADIRQLSTDNPRWLRDVGIGTYAEAETYVSGPFGDWLRLAPGKRVLTATLAVQRNHPILRDPAVLTPIDPAYTLGRFMLTKAPGTAPAERAALEQERDRQIRDTAVDTLYPQGMAPGRRHLGTVPAEGTALGHGRTAPDYGERDGQGREMLTKILLVLRHGLELYVPTKGEGKGKKKEGAHAADYEKDVIRALAHGGRVNIRIPALASRDEAAYWLPHFLGVTRNATSARPNEGVSERDFATHRTAIGANRTDAEGELRPGSFKEKGGVIASLTNKVTVGAASPDLWGKDISGGGFGSKDWNGDMVLPNGSYGHVLLVYHHPTMDKDGSLQIGIETIAPHAESPVGYVHDFRSTEVTSNPESILHGHKGDKVGSGGLSVNERFVDLRKMGAGGDWRTFLTGIELDWQERLAQTDEISEERRALYEELVGPRARP